MQRELIPEYWIRKIVPPAATPGMHRWVWDLHYTAPRSVQRGFPISAVPGDTPREPAGPMAAPGIYQVRLSVGKHQWHVPLTVMADPRVTMSAAEYAVQFATTRRLAETFDESTAALLESRSLRAQLKELSPKVSGSLSDQMHSLDAQIAELLESDQGEPRRRGLERLNGDVAVLYGQIDGVDAAPTAVQIEESERVNADWQSLEPKWRRLQEVDVPALNRALAKARLPRIVPDSAPPRDLNFADED
jgi:hypothetical protein